MFLKCSLYGNFRVFFLNWSYVSIMKTKEHIIPVRKEVL